MRNGPGTKPNPDPTVATNEAVERAMTSERDYVDGEIKVLVERLTGIDKATELLRGSQDRIPEHVAKVTGHLKELVEEKFDSVQTQFTERDTRSEREARDNKLAVDAAFAAQEKQAVAQNESNVLAINKSEAATTETIKTNQQLASSRIDALVKSLDEVKLSVSRMESSKQGATESRSGLYAAIGVIATILIAAVTVVGLVVATTP